jgi:hypothetical protein
MVIRQAYALRVIDRLRSLEGIVNEERTCGVSLRKISALVVVLNLEVFNLIVDGNSCGFLFRGKFFEFVCDYWY